MPAARNAIVVEVDPAAAFAPLKNASGAAIDTPESVKAQISDLHRQWLREAGVGSCRRHCGGNQSPGLPWTPKSCETRWIPG